MQHLQALLQMLHRPAAAAAFFCVLLSSRGCLCRLCCRRSCCGGLVLQALGETALRRGLLAGGVCLGLRLLHF